MIGAGTAAAPRKLPTKPPKTIHFQPLNECMCERTSECRGKEKYEDVAICSPPNVLWSLHSGCAVPSLLSGNICVATNSLNPSLPLCSIWHQIRRMPVEDASPRKEAKTD
jgi:hypothetical protein